MPTELRTRRADGRPVAPIALALLAALVGLTAGCWPGPRERWDTGTRTDMVVYFRPGAPGAEVQRFWREVLNVPVRGGVELAPGLVGADACVGPPGTRAVCLHFGWLSGRSRAALRARAEAWPTVLKVLEDVAPAAVTPADLEP
jgi:hypothetical protein